MTSIALVPARGGSRRVPRKNVRPFLGTPAIGRVLRTIAGSGVADRIVVSTDDEEIAAVSTAAGAEVPGLRPDELADDMTATTEVVRHVISAWLPGEGRGTRLWVVYPTALLIRQIDLLAAARRFEGVEAEFLVTVLRFPHPVERRLRMDESGTLRPDEPQHLASRTQDLRPAFHDAGQFYLGRIGSWLESSPLQSGSSIGFELPKDRVVDIDRPEDWELAERLARATGIADAE